MYVNIGYLMNLHKILTILWHEKVRLGQQFLSFNPTKIIFIILRSRRITLQKSRRSKMDKKRSKMQIERKNGKSSDYVFFLVVNTNCLKNQSIIAVKVNKYSLSKQITMNIRFFHHFQLCLALIKHYEKLNSSDGLYHYLEDWIRTG